MAIVTIAITDVSAATRVVWQKIPLAERRKIKQSLATMRLTDLRRFTFRYAGKPDIHEGYGHKTTLAQRLNLVVTIKSRDNTYARCTMQRMNHQQPFMQLI